jgi:prepilin peptidase CpaA
MDNQFITPAFDQLVTNLALLIPLAVFITFYDVKYRRIPNIWVLFALISGLVKNTILGGWNGMLSSLKGCALALGLMLILHIFGALGAGDVKLFAAIGAIVGVHLVLPTFVIVVFTGVLLAVFSMLRNRTVVTTMQRVLIIMFSLLSNWKIPRFEAPSDRRQTLPYGVAIVFGSLISLVVFRA